MQNVFTFTKDEPFIGKLSGLVTVPTGFDPAKEKLPVILFLHGMGERGDGSEKELPLVTVHGVPKLFAKDPDYLGLRVITVSPQCPVTVTWELITLIVKDYLDAAVERFGGDPARVAVTGLSMGGFGTWSLLSAFPQAFRKAAPICGGGKLLADQLSGVGVRVFHSIDDPCVPYEFELQPVRQAHDAGADVEFTTYCGLGHNCWMTAYEKTDLIRWLADM